MAEKKDNELIRNLILFQFSRKTSDLARIFLSILEELMDEGYIIPEDKYKRIRKRILDTKGNADRELEKLVEKFDFSTK